MAAATRLKVMLPPSLSSALVWYSSPSPGADSGLEGLCATRDAFQARLDTMLRELLTKGWTEEDASLLTAVLGEVGNNSFDHNLGQWPDVAGCAFGREVTLDPAVFWILDRGVGLLSTLRRADPSLGTHAEAVRAGFERVLSGRTPERRGNGLKFVRSVINADPARGLTFQSGGACAAFGGLTQELSEVESRLRHTSVPGAAAVFAWRPTA
jgi:hypothetical protein